LFSFRLQLLPNQGKLPAVHIPRKGGNMTLPDRKTMYSAFLRKDPGFEGIFVVGVKTTGVFCRPTCPARKPKPENIEFLSSAHDALLHGYRPCKVCTPLVYKGAAPDWLKPLLNEINGTRQFRLKDSDLRNRGLQPSRVRYWFKKHHGMTFQAYLRTLRIGQAFGRIRYGDEVTTAAFESGYESLSGFADSFKKTTGLPPSKSNGRRLIATTRMLTPLGPMLAGATEDGICLLEFVDRRALETELQMLRRLLNAETVTGFSRHFETLNGQLAEYFSGERSEFDLPLVLAGTHFQKKVWTELLKIPYGSTRSYREQAKAIGFTSAVRAVARANGENRIAIIIPCHRVIGADGTLVGYGGGLWRKQWLLNLESGKAPETKPTQTSLFPSGTVSVAG
jgi:AraC family transcriptional regulator of adaptative response/methylated-DNA-[protein]-cysteine methyltransferase